MHLKILNRNEDKTNSLFASADCQALLQMYEDYYPKIGFHPPWVAYLVMNENQVMGSCGFTGQPKDGRVEIAYWTFQPFEGKGLASFACRELVKISQSADPGIVITAKTAPEHNASTRILEKNNFRFSGIVQDEEIGDAWQWTLDPIQ